MSRNRTMVEILTSTMDRQFRTLRTQTQRPPKKKKKDPFAGSEKNYPESQPGAKRLPGGTILYPPIRQPALHRRVVKRMKLND